MMTPKRSHAAITAIGTYVPEQVLTNADLERMVDTNNEWIVQRTGIHERRIAAPEEFTSDLCIRAVKNLSNTYGKSLEDVDLVIVATTTPDYPFPSVASRVQAYFGMTKAGAFDMSATCAGFAYGLHVANGLVTSGLHRKVLVIAGDVLSKVTDYTDRTTCILFGDGAGAVLVEPSEEPGFLATHLGAQGEGGIHLYRSGLSTKLDGHDLKADGCIVQNGREVYRWAVTTVPKGMKDLLESAGLSIDDIDWFVPHSANLRMIESICEKSGFPIERTLYSLERYGNTSAATMPLSIAMGVQEGKIRKGDTLLLYGFGGGLVYAGNVIRWLVE
jgi:3-oxoacyl-[acyl-carrier-protein] synthase III